MKRFYSYLITFLMGAVLYPIIEILFRGHSHVSMSLLGGICLMVIRFTDEAMGRLRTVWKAALAAVMITQLELIFGIVLNHGLGLGVWDYSHLPGNLAGQICPLFSFFWFLLSFAAIGLIRLSRRLHRRGRGKIAA